MKKEYNFKGAKRGAVAKLDAKVKRGGGELVDISKCFPDLNDPQKLAAITFRGIRAKTGLSKAEFATKLGLSLADVSEIEGGKREIGKVLAKRIEKEFGID